MTNKFTNRKDKMAAGFLSIIITLANMPMFAASAEERPVIRLMHVAPMLTSTRTTATESAPALSFDDVTIRPADIAENRNVGIDLVLSGGHKGFTEASFGVRYDEELQYTDVVKLTTTGEVFTVTCDTDAHILWFTGETGTDNTCAAQEESIMTLYFDIAENVIGGDFNLEFVWNNTDGTAASWYTEENVNIVDKVLGRSTDGTISLRNPSAETLSSTELVLTCGEEHQLKITNASDDVFWFSTNPGVADVDENGLITTNKAGVCQIKAYTDDQVLACDVTVAAASYAKGDVDGNESIDILDVVLTNQGILGKRPLTNMQYAAADVDGDGVVTPADSLSITKMVVGLL